MFYLSVTREQDPEILEPLHQPGEGKPPFSSRGPWPRIWFHTWLPTSSVHAERSGLIALTGHHLPKSNMTNLSYHISDHQSAIIKDSVQGIVKPQKSAVAIFLNISRS